MNYLMIFFLKNPRIETGFIYEKSSPEFTSFQLVSKKRNYIAFHKQVNNYPDREDNIS